jgi:hypothetical protein
MKQTEVGVSCPSGGVLTCFPVFGHLEDPQDYNLGSLQVRRPSQDGLAWMSFKIGGLVANQRPLCGA